ncbi:hypothetical protein Pfo_013807, partial [Paulownia fortunei]
MEAGGFSLSRVAVLLFLVSLAMRMTSLGNIVQLQGCSINVMISDIYFLWVFEYLVLFVYFDRLCLIYLFLRTLVFSFKKGLRCDSHLIPKKKSRETEGNLASLLPGMGSRGAPHLDALSTGLSLSLSTRA